MDKNSLVSKLTKDMIPTNITNNITSSGTLSAGVYKVELSGAGGGGGGNRHIGGWGGLGGAGELNTAIFILSAPGSYTFVSGKGGEGGAGSTGKKAGDGGAGGDSKFEIEGVISLIAHGGGGGQGGNKTGGTDGKPGGGVGGGASGGNSGSTIYGTEKGRTGTAGSNGYIKMYKYD